MVTASHNYLHFNTTIQVTHVHVRERRRCKMILIKGWGWGKREREGGRGRERERETNLTHLLFMKMLYPLSRDQLQLELFNILTLLPSLSLQLLSPLLGQVQLRRGLGQLLTPVVLLLPRGSRLRLERQYLIIGHLKLHVHNYV